jgi:predicted DCC family thiol-disulfide oxidoreductase YuxK
MQWIIDHDAQGRFHYAPLQGSTAAEVRARHPEIPLNIDSILLVVQTPEGEKVSWYSDALIGIATELDTPWRWVRLGRWLPTPLRNLAYRSFAKVRYRVFGKLDSCRVPTPELMARFLP